MSTDFQISGWKPFRKNTLRGFFTLTLPSGLVIHNCSLHEKDAGQRWIGLPSQKFTKEDGSVAYKPLLEFVDRETADKFRDLALEAIDAMKDGHL